MTRDPRDKLIYYIDQILDLTENLNLKDSEFNLVLAESEFKKKFCKKLGHKWNKKNEFKWCGVPKN
jgi:hypothetical protein